MLTTQTTAKRNSYASWIKQAASMDLLSKEIKKQIPKSTLHRFKNTDYSYLFDAEIHASHKEKLEVHKFIEKHKRIYKILKAYIHIMHTITKINATVIKRQENYMSKSLLLKQWKK